MSTTQQFQTVRLEDLRSGEQVVVQHSGCFYLRTVNRLFFGRDTTLGIGREGKWSVQYDHDCSWDLASVVVGAMVTVIHPAPLLPPAPGVWVRRDDGTILHPEDGTLVIEKGDRPQYFRATQIQTIPKSGTYMVVAE